MKHITHWIDGRPWAGHAERQGEVFNPATGVQSAWVDFADTTVVDAAVTAAERAFDAWRHASLAQRSQILFAFRQRVHARREELAALVTAEHGKVLADALGEVNRGLEVVEFACGIPHLLKGGYSESVSSGVDVYSIRQPLGVCGVISPFNFPVMVPMWFYPIAIAAGNTVIVKPSEKDPSVSNRIAELWAEAGLPDGVFNVVHGDKQAVDRLLEHPRVKGLSFVGSTAIAKYIYETGAKHGKRVQALDGTAIFTRDGGAARRFQHEVEVGMVGINVPIPVPVAYYSFGGWKASLFGDSHAHGTEGVHFFTRGKVVTSRWPDPQQGGINLGFPQNK